MQHPSVFPAWFLTIPLQQQSVLVLALRGPDGVAKHHPCKTIIRNYRATVLCAAKYGRWLMPTYADMKEHPGDTFMNFEGFVSDPEWTVTKKGYFNHVDELALHYHHHFMHGAQILGCHHPEEFIRRRWWDFYGDCAELAHLNVELKAQMDERLGDWDRRFWNE